jgi:hypothetical protein
MDAQTLKEIENVLVVLRKQEEKITDLENQRRDARADLIQSLAKDFASTPLSYTTGARQKNWEDADKKLEEEIKVAKELRNVILARIDELKVEQKQALNDAIQKQVKQLDDWKASLERMKVP